MRGVVVFAARVLPRLDHDELPHHAEVLVEEQVARPT
jgi:hypothetical protein